MKRFIIIPLLFIAFALLAAPVNERQARDIAMTFFQSSAPTRSATVGVELVFAGNDFSASVQPMSSIDSDSESLIYIYNRSDIEGFVVIAGDDAMRSVIAFSFNNSFNVENIAASTRHILSAWCRQVAAARSGQSRVISYSSASRVGDVGSVICYYETAKWGQSNPYNLLAPVINGQRSVTGCAATALAIVARYNQYPEKGKGTIPGYTYEYTGPVVTIPSNTLGHTYDYANMPLSYASGYNSTQADAVARLMYDMGTASQMMYSPSGSGTTSHAQIRAMVTYFGYDKESTYLAMPHMFGSTKFDNRGWITALKKNLQEYGPTLFGGQSPDGGHAFVLDGVTTRDYFSINWGWDGYNDGYYQIPSIEYADFQDAIFGAKRDPLGVSVFSPTLTLFAGSTSTILLTGINCRYSSFAQGVTYNLIPGIVTNQSSADFTGSIVVAHCDKDGAMKRVLGNVAPSPVTIPVNSYLSRIYSLQITISDKIEVGDRLRILYWTDSSANAKWARSNGADSVIDEIVMRATPDEIADKLSFVYDKSSATLTFKSSLPIVYTVKQTATGAVVGNGEIIFPNESLFSVASFVGKGEYTFSFTCGDEPYILRMTF